MALQNSRKILSKLDRVMSQISEKEINELKKLIFNSNRLFFAGTGRSLLVIKAVAMRFMQFGFEVYVVGETTTPSFKKDDLLVAASGSGETKSTILFMENAKKIGGKTAVITAAKNSSLAKISDQVLEIPINKIIDKNDKLVPGGSLFEEAVLVLGDYLIVDIAAEKDISFEKLFKMHANLE